MDVNTEQVGDLAKSWARMMMRFVKAVPGSAIVMRYIASSYQHDPIRSLLELILFIYALRIILQSRTRGGEATGNYVQLDEKVCVAGLDT